MKTVFANSCARGFTLIEAIIVIVLIGVLSAVVAVFIRAPLQGYADSVSRAELTDQADLALQRMGRELRRALPNSVTVNATGSAAEFLLTRAGGRYLSVEDGAAAGSALDFQNASNTTFTVVGSMPSLYDNVDMGDYIVVNNQGRGVAPTDAYQFAPNCNCNIAQVNAVDRDTSAKVVRSITLASNPFASQQPSSMPSPDQRFQVVSGPVSYVCEADGNGAFTLFRYSGYAISSSQAVPPVGATLKAPLATRVDRCDGLFRYEQGAQRVGLVIITLSLRARNSADPSIRLVYQVHADNTP